MGVSGSGKTTVGRLLSHALNIPFYDADDFHPESNRQKMQKGKPLTDDDRYGWLVAINRFAKEKTADTSLIVACSALKQKYRDLLAHDLDGQCQWAHLAGDFTLIEQRMQARESHFMPSSLLHSQFEILETPSDALALDIRQSPEVLVHLLTKHFMNTKSQFGLIGLGVMGKSLCRNLANHGVGLSLYNRFVKGSEEKVAETFIAQHPELQVAKGFEDLQAFVASLETPRKVFLMVNAGSAVDDTIEALVPLLEAGDVVIDGGNSYYKETERRFQKLKQVGLHFIGTGVSGGEEGALKGPAIMPGGSVEGYAHAGPFLEKIAAKSSSNGICCAYIGNGGAGHFVKTVHNGIEYAEMQLLAEVYNILRWGKGLDPDTIADVLQSWLDTDVTSYLLEITVDILRKKEGNAWLIDLILDKAGNKGTGGWTTMDAAELGVPIPTITAALFARYVSELKDERVENAAKVDWKASQANVSLEELLKAYRLARIINLHQGIHLIQTASDKYGWEVNLSQLASIWTNGCIIRSALMVDMVEVLKFGSRILQHNKMQKVLADSMDSLSQLVSQSILARIPVPCFSAAHDYVCHYFQATTSANIIQAQRDYFGAHTYQRADDPTGKAHHTHWI
jgi:6-phosphogluconate dehydrogenase